MYVFFALTGLLIGRYLNSHRSTDLEPSVQQMFTESIHCCYAIAILNSTSLFALFEGWQLTAIVPSAISMLLVLALMARGQFLCYFATTEPTSDQKK